MAGGGDTLHGPVKMWLTLFSGSVPVDTVEITGPRFLIGRDERCDLALDDPKVSKEHAVILPGSGPFRLLRDLGSTNGTLVNGRPLRAPAGYAPTGVKETELGGGEWLQVGDTVARVSLIDPRQAPASEPPHPSEPTEAG